MNRSGLPFPYQCLLDNYFAKYVCEIVGNLLQQETIKITSLKLLTEILIFWKATHVLKWLVSFSIAPLTSMSNQDRVSPYQYDINQISDENREKYQFGDNKLIQY